MDRIHPPVPSTRFGQPVSNARQVVEAQVAIDDAPLPSIPPARGLAARAEHPRRRSLLLAAGLLTILLGSLTACGPVAEPIRPQDAGSEQNTTIEDAEAMREAIGNNPDPLADNVDDGVEEITVTLTEFGIDLPVTRFHTGRTYRFLISNTGALSHELRILPLGTSAEMLTMEDGGHAAMGDGHEHAGELLLASGDALPAGGDYSVEHVFRQPGDFEFACHFAGHLEGGMMLPIEVDGEAVPISEDDIRIDTTSMPDVSCHAMGTTIMGDCSEEDIARLKREILEEAAASEMEHSDGMDEMHDEDDPDHDQDSSDEHDDQAASEDHEGESDEGDSHDDG